MVNREDATVVPAERPGPLREAWEPVPRRRSFAALGVILVLALALRAADAALGSLRLDDFHSLHHARAEGFIPFLESLLEDNHPPLSFLLLRITRALGGENDLVLRIPSLLAGLGLVLLAWRLSRHLSTLRLRTAATALVAFSSLHVEYSADLRMYALLALAVAGALDAAIDLLEEGTGAKRLVFWSVVGLYTHYHALHALAVLFGGALLSCAMTAAYRTRARTLLRAMVGIAVLSLPWYALAFPRQLQHGLPPGGSEVSFSRFGESMVHLVFLNLRLAGDAGRPVLLGAGVLLVLLAVTGVLRWTRADLDAARPARVILLFAVGFLLPLWSALAAWLLPRAGFEWRYLTGSIAPFAVLAAAGASGTGATAAPRRAALAAAVASAFVLALLNVRDPGREDYEGAARHILERASSADAVLAADWQPRIFPHGIGWRYYRDRLAGGESPVDLPATYGFALEPDVEPSQYERVFCILRSPPAGAGFLRRLRKVFPREEVVRFGEAVFVHEFTRD